MGTLLPSGTAALAHRPVIGWLRGGFWAVLDQGLFAAANFLLTILLARWMAPAEYGAFAVAYSIFLLFAASYGATLTEPMLVFAASRFGASPEGYLRLLLRGHWVLTGVGGLILGVIGGCVILLGSPAVGIALIGLALAGPLILLIWFLRRVFYIRSQIGWAAAASAGYAALLSVAVYGLHQMGWLSPLSALLGMGLVSLLVSVALLLGLRPHRQRTNPAVDPDAVWRAHWTYGKWAIGTALLTWVPTNIYYAILPVWVGLEGTAALRAAMNFILPVIHVSTALSLAALPRFAAALANGGMAALHQLVRMTLAVFILGAGLYGLALVIAGEASMKVLYAGKYGLNPSGWVILGLLSVVIALEAAYAVGLRARERPDLVFRCYAISSVVAIVLGGWLLPAKGVDGALLTLLTSSLVAAGCAAWGYKSLGRWLGSGS